VTSQPLNKDPTDYMALTVCPKDVIIMILRERNMPQ